MRVVSIAHSAVSTTSGRLRYRRLFELHPDIRLRVVIPERWYEYGRWVAVDKPCDMRDRFVSLSARWLRGGRASWYLHHYPALGKLLRAERPDVVHLWEEPWSLVALQAIILRNWWYPGAAIVLEVDQNIQKVLPLPFQQIRRFVLGNTDYILARSRDAIDVVRGNGYAGPAELIGYGVDSAVFRRFDRAACRAEFGLDGFTIGYVGRLIPEKGLTDVIDAMRHCDAALTLAIMGEGPDRTELVERGAGLRPGQRLVFYPWGQPEQVARFLNAIDVLALTTYTTNAVKEQFGRVIIEAHSCGTPVLGSECGAIPDVVGAGGWIVPERDPEAIARVIRSIVRSPDLRIDAGRAGEAQVLQRFDMDQIATLLVGSWRAASQSRRDRSNPPLG